MVDVDKLSDAELRTKLLEFGFPVMPITGTTRKVMAKKLKMLLENKNKAGSDGRRSLGRYSSEEESDADVKSVKKDKNRRATMAAPVMQPPSSRTTRKIERELSPSPKKRESRISTTTTTTRSQKILTKAQDEFDTGSDSESEIVASTNRYSSNKNDVEYEKDSPIKSKSFASSTRYSPPKNLDSSYTRSNNNASPSRHTSFGSNSVASEYAAERLNQIRSRLSLGSSAYERPSYTTSQKLDQEETPFLSNFTRRLSALSANKTNLDKDDIVKEHDANGSSSYTNTRSYLGSYRASKGRDSLYEYKNAQSGILKNNFVSFAVLAGAALFFVFLAVMYLGIRSDTSVVPSGYIIPYCVKTNPESKLGVNCVLEDQVATAIHLLNVLKPELHKRAVAHKCFDASIKPQMTDSEIITYCLTNFGIRDDFQIKRDLRTLQVMIFANPAWEIKIAQAENNNGAVTEENVVGSMEKVVFNYDKKTTSLVITNPDVPWKCSLYKTSAKLFNIVLVFGILFISLYVFSMAYKYYRYYQQKQKDELGFLVEKIIDILQSAVNDDNLDNFVVINHVRDMILPVSDRKRKQGIWSKAVKYINENESRVRTEVRTVQGEPFEVWKWIGGANVSITGDKTDFKYRPGRRIVDVQYIVNEVLKFPHRNFFFCRSSDVQIKNEVREGFFSIYLLCCRRCKKEHPVCSEEPDSDFMDINLAFVAGVVSLGLDLYQLNELCSSAQIPTISRKNYQRYVDEIHEIYNESKSENSFGSSASTTKSERLNATLDEVKQEIARNDENWGSRKEIFLRELEKDLDKIQELTVNQNDVCRQLWYDERKKRLTASNFGRIFKLQDKTDRKNVIKELLYTNFTGNIYTKYGQENESKAIKDFEKVIGQNVQKCGLFVHKDYPFLAATPDGLLPNNCIVEIKCPYNAQNSTPIEGVEKKEIKFGAFNGDSFVLKRDDKYYYQVQGQLFVTGREFCYFVVWTPKGLAYEKIEKDENCWSKMFPKLESFYFEHLLPVVLSEH